jgi:hypothetical protein
MGMSKMSSLRFFIASALLFASCIGIAPAPAAGESSPVASKIDQGMVHVENSEFEVAYPYQNVRVGVNLRNISEEVLTITAIKPRLKGDKNATSMPVQLSSGETGKIEVTVSVGNTVGRIARYFDVFSEGHQEPIGSFSIRGFVDWVVSPDSTSIDFGRIDLSTGVSKTLTIKLRPGADLKLEKIIDAGNHFRAKVLADGHSVQLDSKKNAPLGLFDEYIVVSTSDASQSKVGFRVRGQFLTRLVPSANPVDFGLLRLGNTSERLIRLENVDGTPVKIGALRTEGAPATAQLQDCIPKDDSCKNLRLQLPAQQVRGQVGGVVHVELLPSKLDLPINFGAVVIGRDTQIRSFEEDQKAAAAAEPAVSDLLKNAIRQPAKPVEMPAPAGAGPLLTWQVTNEYGVFGYEVYRGDSSSGPFRRVTDDFIRRLDYSGQVGSVYRWRDASAVAGKSYYYYVGLVYEDGRKREFTTPQMVIAK